MAYSYCPYCARELGADQICSHCGQTPESYSPQPHHFPAGTILDQRYWVGRVLGEGGFGITYLGYDAKLERRLAIKEYYPSHIVHRTSGATEVTCYQKDREEFDKGKEQFLNEARVLAKLDNVPNIVRVLDYFPANGTAYIVMEFLEGETLKARVKKRGTMEPEELISLLQPLMKALHQVHRTGLIHRDISPDNIMILADLMEEGEQLKLMDFGCARDATSGKTMTVMLKPGFAPFEQYSGTEQGPWTDVYALSATIYYCLTGKTPPNAMNRMDADTIQPPSALGVKIGKAQEQALMKGLAVRTKDRWQSVTELRQALNETPDKPTKKPKSAPRPEKPRPVPQPQPEPKPVPNPVSKSRKPLWLIAVAAALVVCLSVALIAGRGNDEERLSSPKTTAGTTAAPVETTETTVPVNPETDNILMSIPEAEDYEKEPAFNTGALRSQVTSITFLDTLADAPDDAVDASLAGNGRVLAWAEELGTNWRDEPYYALYIAAEGGVYAPEDSSRLFRGFETLKTIDFGRGFCTENVTNMSRMFQNCGMLEELDLSGFTTGSVTDMSYMFNSCHQIQSLDLSSFDTGSVTDMTAMFKACTRVTQLRIESFDTSRVGNMNSMFYLCEKLTKLDLSFFDTRNVTDMYGMFAHCVKLESLNLSSFDTRNVLDMRHMFDDCDGFTELDLSSFDTGNVTDFGWMFYHADNLNNVIIGRLETSQLSSALQYSDFMDPGRTVNGKPWESYFE